MVPANDTLWHITWGDGDNSFVVAPDKATARERMGEVKGIITSMVALDTIYQQIFKAGQEEATLRLQRRIEFIDGLIGYSEDGMAQFRLMAKALLKGKMEDRMTDKELTQEQVAWLKNNAYAIKGKDSWFITDFPENEVPDKLVIPMDEKRWKAIWEVMRK